MDIVELRKQIATIDEEILQLVARRQRVARAIGDAKGSHATLRNFAQEKEVLLRARRLADSLELSPELATSIMQRLIESSLTAQEKQRVEAASGGSGQRALVIGGAGRMGGWMTRFLASQGFAIEVADPVPPSIEVEHLPDWRDSPLDHDLLVVTASLRASREILADLADRRPAGVVFDIGSLKTPLRQPLALLVEAGVQTASIHPMFGPDTELLCGRHVILVDLGCEPANRRVIELFGSTMAEIVRMPLEDHDRLIAFVLGLSHALNLAFVTALAESGEEVPHLERISSTTFDRQLGVTAAVTRDNPHLYFEIQNLNAFGGESLRSLRQATAKLEAIVEAGDESGFVDLMEQGRRYLAGRSGNGEGADLG